MYLKAYEKGTQVAGSVPLRDSQSSAKNVSSRSAPESRRCRPEVLTRTFRTRRVRILGACRPSRPPSRGAFRLAAVPKPFFSLASTQPPVFAFHSPMGLEMAFTGLRAVISKPLTLDSSESTRSETRVENQKPLILPSRGAPRTIDKAQVRRGIS